MPSGGSAACSTGRTRVFEEFSGWFSGKTSPVHLFWHSLDLAVTRFSGRPAPPRDADAVTREAYSHELISFGFWPGDDALGDAAYYSYTSPEPAGLRDSRCRSARGSRPAPARSPYSPTRRFAPRAIRARRCSRSARAATRRAPDSPAGTRPASVRVVPEPGAARRSADNRGRRLRPSDRARAPRAPARPGARGHAAYAAAAASVGASPSSAIAISRIRNFWILPVTVIGNASTNFQ